MKVNFTQNVLAAGIICLALFFPGCDGDDGLTGRDGNDGNSAIGIMWTYGDLFYDTDNPAIPQIFFSGQYFISGPGTFSYWYRAWDGSEWIGNYTITIDRGKTGEPGEKGKSFWRDGEDGEDGADGVDYCFSLYCYSVGPSLTVNTCASIGLSGEKTKLELEKIRQIDFPSDGHKTSMKRGTLQEESQHLSTSTSGMEEEEGRKGNYGFVHSYKQIK